MAWTMTLKNKEMIGTIPDQIVRLTVEVSNGAGTTFTKILDFEDANAITPNGLKMAIKNQIYKGIDLAEKFNDLDKFLNHPVDMGI